MSSAYENAMSDLQANNATQQYPVTAPTQRHCPVCGALVPMRNVYGSLMLDYHLSAKVYRVWCSGSDMNLTEAE